MAQAQQFDPSASYSPATSGGFDPGASYAPAVKAAPVQQGPTISAGTTQQHQPISAGTIAGKPATFTPPTTALEEGIAKLKEWAGLTQEGQQQHPVQSAVGQFADRLKGMLVGGAENKQNNVGTGEYGFLNNPVTAMVSAAPSDEAIDTTRKVVSAVKNLATAPVKAAQESEAANAIKQTASGVKQAVTQSAAPETGSTSVAQLRGAGTTGGPATTSITNDDIVKYAADNGIRLTSAQRTLSESAKSEQALGEEAFGTGNLIKEAVTKEKSKLADAVSGLQDQLDPQRVGMSPEAAGEHLQNSADIARSVMKDNVNQAYNNVREQQADLAGDVQGPLQKFIHDETFTRQPNAAVEQPVFKTSAERSAISDIQNMLDDPAMQGRQSIQSLRNLRSDLLEKGSDYGANALSDSGQRIYKLAASKVDSAIMDAAKGTPFEDTFRDAGAQNSKLQELYNSRKSPIYRILNEDDPAKVANGILARKSVNEIETLKGENFDTGPIARQVIEDIKNGGFSVTKKGLGGYSDPFLRSLLGPDVTKELYTQGEISRRLAENYNPSRSGRLVLGAAQAVHPALGTVFAQGARLRSMPEDVSAFLPKSVPISILKGTKP